LPQISCRDRLHVVVRLERLAGAKIVLVVVLDVAKDREGDDPVVVGEEPQRSGLLRLCDCQRNTNEESIMAKSTITGHREALRQGRQGSSQ
jgi:hypothetical protein